MPIDPTKRPLEGVRALVVEDHEDTRELYSAALELAGAEVRAVADAQEAIRMILKWPLTIVVSDLAIPGMDGTSLLQEIRSLHTLRSIPAIAVSGSADPERREASLAAGFQEYATKPLTPSALVALVRQVTDLAKSDRPT